MVDTVKLLLPIPDPLALDSERFAPLSVRQLIAAHGYASTFIRHASTYAKSGIYMPRLTLAKHVRKTGIVYQLVVEFSAPKLLYGNNFDELAESDFEALLTVLQKKIEELLGYTFTKEQLAAANISTWHASKNIVLSDYTACQTVLNTISKLDISKQYDLQQTDFHSGYIVHLHTNSTDIAFYDKVAGLGSPKVSN